MDVKELFHEDEKEIYIFDLNVDKPFPLFLMPSFVFH